MQITDTTLNIIKEIFTELDFGKVTFYVTPDRNQLNYAVEKQGKIPLEKPVKKYKIRIDKKTETR